MKKRILELAEQADVYVEDDMLFADILNAKTQKFAELITRECLSVVYEVGGEPATDTHFVIGYDRACEKISNAIKEHFGVTQ